MLVERTMTPNEEAFWEQRIRLPRFKYDPCPRCGHSRGSHQMKRKCRRPGVLRGKYPCRVCPCQAYGGEIREKP